jgi:predicted nuclease of predicted toxin-antitoxin system
VNVWIDAQLSPALATWFLEHFGIEAIPVRALDLRNADDETIFQAARNAQAVVLTKDSDFVRLLERHGPPPQVVWVTCGNTSNATLTAILINRWRTVQKMLDAGEALVEISGPAGP